MAKAEIGWTRRIEDGTTLELYARKVGDQWRFFQRERRYDSWKAIPQPPREDWLTLLDALERRLQRRLVRPEDVRRLKQIIREHFPDSDRP
jgi:hypothetical protein